MYGFEGGYYAKFIWRERVRLCWAFRIFGGSGGLTGFCCARLPAMPLILIILLLILVFGGGGYYMGPGPGYYGGGGISIVLAILLIWLIFGRGRRL